MLVPIAIACIVLTLILGKLFIVPRRLSHLPRAPVLPLLRSYLSGESEEQRIRRILLPFANEHGHPLVLVWTFGLWIVHVLDFEVGGRALKDRDWVRTLPPQDLLFWQLVGKSNVAFTVGESWKKHANAVKTAFQGSPPIESFVRNTNQLLHLLGPQGGQFQWDELSQRITLDNLGDAIMGYQFNAILAPDSPFVKEYREINEALIAPPYIFLPFLDKYFPRNHVVEGVKYLRGKFAEIIEAKREKRGEDVISRMLDDASLDSREVLDNVSILFIAGHETTAGALSSVVYYLAKFPQYQDEARREVLSVLQAQGSESPNISTLTQMHFLLACIREALRMNNPSNFTMPREAEKEMFLGGYTIPPKTMMCFNMSVIHHLEATWKVHDIYNPHRYREMTTEALPLASFGLGLRRCPAQHFAMWQVRTVLAILLANYRWSLPKQSIHHDRICNGFSFSSNLNMPKDLEIEFVKLDKNLGAGGGIDIVQFV